MIYVVDDVITVQVHTQHEHTKIRYKMSESLMNMFKDAEITLMLCVPVLSSCFWNGGVDFISRPPIIP